ncbi:MAG: HD domain-containing protein [Planctomycetota bacterium]|nr:HD domain-containing protein [Planctomycetota bacterium]
MHGGAGDWRLRLDFADTATLVEAIARKDMATAAHTWRVSLYARAMAERAGLDHGLIERLTRAAALHDVGKLTVPDEVLQKPGPLTAAERTIMERHAADGHAMLVAAGEDDPLVLDLVRHHHERQDGTGYPDRLAGEAIPLAARYFAVIDAFDAMTSVRPYRSDVGPDAARRALLELRAKRGVWYCGESVETLAALVEAGNVAWITAYHNETCPIALPARRAGQMK